MWRYLNMFVLIGIVLIAVSLIGFATGNRFLTEPGQPVNPQGSLVYLGAGILMLINGIVSIRHAEAMKSHPRSQPPQPPQTETATTRSAE
jgi:hypothetical protein